MNIDPPTVDSLLHEHIKAYLDHLAAHPPDNGQFVSYAIADDARGHYLVLDVGWSGGRRVHATVLHVRLAKGVVIIEHDGTPDGIESWLVARGVPEDRIVNGLQMSMPVADRPQRAGGA